MFLSSSVTQMPLQTYAGIRFVFWFFKEFSGFFTTFSRNPPKHLIAGLITMSVRPRATLSESALSITAARPCYCTAIRSFHSRAEWTAFELSQVVPVCSYQAEVLLTAQVEKEGFHSFDPAPHPNCTRDWLHTCGLTCQPHSLAFCVQLYYSGSGTH